MFASKTQREIEIKGVNVVVRKLSGASLEKAKLQRQIVLGSQLKAMGGAVARELQRKDLDDAVEKIAAKREAETVETKRKARLEFYDRETVLMQGIVRWDAEEKVTPESIADLEEEFAQSIFEAVLDLSLPKLDPAEAEAEGKGSTAASISS